MDALRIGVVGCTGRMGRMVARCVDQTEGCELAGGTDRADCGAIGRDLGELAGIGPRDLIISDDPAAMIAKADAVIDFTTPEALLRHAELAAQAEAGYVVGTTGLGAEQQAALERAGLHTAVVQAANMSLGVNLLLALVERVGGALDGDYDIEIIEMHHRFKKDAPSGTALALGRAIAGEWKRDLNAASMLARAAGDTLSLSHASRSASASRSETLPARIRCPR